MPIQVTCPGCKATFNVSSKYAGRQGPCPKCRTVINIPKEAPAAAAPPPAEVKIHAPDEEPRGAGGEAKTSTGRHLSKPIERRDSRLTPLSAGLVTALVVAMFGLAHRFGALLLAPYPLLPGEYADPQLAGPYYSVLYRALALRLAALYVLGFPVVWAGYQMLRDDELAPFRGRELTLRSLICTTVYVALWGCYQWIPADVAAAGYSWLYLAPPFFIVGAVAAYFCFELDPTSSGVHYSFFVFITLMLGMTAGLTMPWSDAPHTLPNPHVEEMQFYDEFGRPVGGPEATPGGTATGTGPRPAVRPIVPPSVEAPSAARPTGVASRLWIAT